MSGNKKDQATIKVKGVVNMLHNKYMRMWAIYSPLKSVYISDGKR